MSRPHFMVLLASLALFACAAAPFAAAADDSTTKVAAVKSPRMLFVDDHHLSQITGLKRTMNPVQKHQANPVLRPDRPWEGSVIYAIDSTMWDEKDKLFKIWYRSNGTDQTYLATSKDGLHWDKPNLGLVDYKGSTANNILKTKVMTFVYGGDDFGPAPEGQLFRGVAWNQERGQHMITSADGLHWQDGPSIHIEGVGDTFVEVKSTAPLTGEGDLPAWPARHAGLERYLGVARWIMPVGKFNGSSDLHPSRRVQAFVSSNDFVNWHNAARILTPDGLDDQMAQDRIKAAVADGALPYDEPEDRRCEFYTMWIVPYEDLYMGMLLVLDASYEFHRVGKNNQAGVGHMQLVASRDLLTWQRLGERKPFIPRGRAGQFDQQLAWYPSMPIVKDGKLWFFYTGSSMTHAGTRDEALWKRREAEAAQGKWPPLESIGLGTLRRDGWVSLDAGSTPGTAVTKTIFWPNGGKLYLNADARGGEVRISVCQPDLTPYGGYERSEPISGDNLEAPVVFAANKPMAAGTPVRLKITAQNARLYSVWFK
jgi:hypothetical protein